MLTKLEDMAGNFLAVAMLLFWVFLIAYATGVLQEVRKPNTSGANNQQPPASVAVLNNNKPAAEQTANNQASEDRKIQAALVAETQQLAKFTEWLVAATFIVGVAGLWNVIITRGSSRRQLCAYVLPDSALIIDGNMLNPPQPARVNIPGIVLTIKNTGQTPAYKVVSWMQIEVLPTNQENALVIPRLQNLFSLTLGVGTPFSKAMWFHRPVTAAEVQAISAGTTAIFLYGRIEYRDAFKRKRWSNFRFRYTAALFPPLPGAILNTCESGNESI